MLVPFVLGTVIPGCVVVFLVTYAMRALARRWNFVDHPGERKVHSSAIPLGGGLAIWSGVVVSLGILYVVVQLAPESGWDDSRGKFLSRFLSLHGSGIVDRAKDVIAVLVLATVMLAIGLIDDWRGLDWRWRLALQAVVAGVVVFGLQWRLTLFVDHRLVTSILTMFWIVGLVNSFNMLDNMDGLSAGVAAIASAMLAIVLLMPPYAESSGPQLFVAGFLLLLCGSLVGFLPHNFPRASIFMGDAGSYFVGFCMAIATILASFARYEDSHRHTILAPLCVLAVPLYDTITVVWLRIRSGRSPFVGDQSHLSHRLVSLGMSKAGAVGTIYLLTFTCGLGAWLLATVDRFGAAVILLIEICILALIAILEWTAQEGRQGTGRHAQGRHGTGDESEHGKT